MNLTEYTAYLSARTGQQVTTDQVIDYLLHRKNTMDDDQLHIYLENGVIVHQADEDDDWKVIGHAGIDSGHLILVDPCNAREAATEWDEYVTSIETLRPAPRSRHCLRWGAWPPSPRRVAGMAPTRSRPVTRTAGSLRSGSCSSTDRRPRRPPPAPGEGLSRT